MDYGFDRVIDRNNTNCVKFDMAKKHGMPEGILPMWVADMDFMAPPSTLEALKNFVDYGIFGYSFMGDDYFNALEGWFRENHGWEVSREWVSTTPGVVFALSAAIRAVTQKGDAVMIQPPVYPPFYEVIERNERKKVENTLVYENGKYSIDFEDMEKKIAENDVKLMILCSPHNPVGRVWTVDELQKVGSICRKYNVTVVSDEIHCDFAFPDHPHTPFVKACPEMMEQAIVCTAPSKTFNLAGLQVSNIFVPGEQLRARFRKVMGECFYGEPNCLGMLACQAAYQGGKDWLENCKAYMRENLAYMRKFLQENIPQIKVVEPEGTYLVWLDCSGLGLSKQELYDLFAYKAKVWVDNGDIFGEVGAQFIRVVLASPRETVRKAMEQLKKAIDG